MKERWGFDDVPSQAGRTALVTGANSGLGYQTALMLARRGASVVLACRSMANAESAMASMRGAYPAEDLNLTAVAPLDLSDLGSVEAFAREFAARYSRLDLLVNNAGVMVPPFARTRQGFELQFGVNHLGHFALTGRLLPLLSGVEGARIVSLSSIAAWWGSVRRMLDDPNYERRRYDKWRAYGASKLADQMFIQEMARRLAAQKARAIAVAAHPGVSATGLFKYGRLGEWYASHFAQPPAMGALPVLRAACDPGAANGSYWGPDGFMEMSGYPVPARIPRRALDATSCRRLWELSEELTGVHY
jgi:NAD(P)-dependent dehydrogenase (short-subunit alcohol dehydrogenase family)